MLGVCRQTHMWLSMDTGRFPKIDSQQISVLKYWCHILSLPPESVVRRAYNMLIHLDRLGKQNWVSHVKSLLTGIQLFDCFRLPQHFMVQYIKIIYYSKSIH